MPSFDTVLGLIPLLDQVVLVNGASNDLLWCVSIKRGLGIGGCSADFIVPQARFDSDRDDLKGAFVTIYVTNSYDESSPGVPDFVGYLDVDSAHLDESDDSYTVSASGPTAYLEKVSVGINEHRPTCEFPLSDPETGKPTKWTPARVLQDVFGTGGPKSVSGGMPSEYRTRYKLGDLSVLNTTENNSTPALCFRNLKYGQAVKSVLDLFGDVTFLERYDETGVCYLDFLRIQDLAQPFVSATLGTFTDPITGNVNVASIDWKISSHDCVTRFVAYGGYLISIITLLDDDDDLEMRLVKGWDTDLEAKVIANPERAKPGAIGYLPGMEFVFRRYYLPACLNGFTKLKNLVIQREPINETQPGPAYPIQVYKKSNVLTANPTTGVYTAAEGPRQLIKNFKEQLDQNYIELATAEDGLRATGFTQESGGPKYTWERAPVRITIAIAHKERIYADTGQDLSNALGFDFGHDGLMDETVREDMLNVQFTNHGRAIHTSKGSSLEFDAAFYDEDAKEWRVYTSSHVARNDKPHLEWLAAECLKEKQRPHKSCSLDIPYFARAYQPGRQLIVENDANWELPLMIGNVSWDLVQNTTSVSADNCKPAPKHEMKTAFRGRFRPTASTH